MKKILATVAAGLGVAFLAIQLVPYGRDHAAPPPAGEPAWDSPRTRELAARACFDCHSRETKWPVYASVAPFSWAVQHHVEEGRAALDFQGGPAGLEEGEEAAEVLAEGEMPPAYYTALHPEARLTAEERQALVTGLERTFGAAEGSDFASREGREGAGGEGAGREREGRGHDEAGEREEDE